MTTIFPLLFFFIICGVIGMALGDLGGKKNGKVGFLLGFLLGPLGIVISPFLPAECQKQAAGEKSHVKLLLIAAAVIAALIGLALVMIYR